MIAFSDYVRTVIWLIYKYLITLTVIKSGLYDRVYLSLDWKSKDLVRTVEDRVTQMKAEVKAARQKRVKRHSKYSSNPAGESSPGSSGAGVADSSKSSGSRLRPRSLRFVGRGGCPEDLPHVIRMEALSPDDPTTAASTAPPTSARNPVTHATSAPGLLQP